MKTKYKYIHFEQVEEQGWFCRNNKSKYILGSIEYYQQWKQYVIQFKPDAVFNNTCLLDIADFLKRLNEAKK